MPRSDTELLASFARSRDERAFEELVVRHLGLVLGSARRRLHGRNELAEEVAQNVFVTLAGKAAKLLSHPCLPAWLLKTTSFEAMRAAEKETNHARKMKRLQTEMSASPPTGESNDPHLEAALPVLDEAMAALAEGDRRALMLRFYEGRSFRIIATLSGKSEAACQKQTRRAIHKLGALLRRRGVGVPAASLVAGLTAVLTKTASAESAASITHTALGQSAVVGAFSVTTGGLISNLILMNTKTTFTVGAAALIACAGTGFIAGAVAKRSDGKDSSATLRASAGAPAGGRSSSGTANGGSTESSDEILLRLLNLARGELQGADYDILAATRAMARIASIPFDQIPAALDMIAAMPGGFETNDVLTDSLLARWAEHDGRAACEFSLKNRTPPTMGLTPIRAPLMAWAQEDPQSALQWYLEKSEKKHPGLAEEKRGLYTGISNIRWIMRAWIHRDIDGAVQAFHTLDKKYQQGAVTAMNEHAGPLPGREKLLDAYKSLPKYIARDAIRGSMDRWSMYRPEELARWIDENEVEGVNPIEFAYPVMWNWLIADRDAAIEWYFSFPQEHGLGRHLSPLIRGWSARDLVGAGEWLAEQERTEDYDAAIVDFSRNAARQEPKAAMEWALSIEDHWQRGRTVVNVAKEWAKKDVGAARIEVEAADIPADQKSALLESPPFVETEETP